MFPQLGFLVEPPLMSTRFHLLIRPTLCFFIVQAASTYTIIGTKMDMKMGVNSAIPDQTIAGLSESNASQKIDVYIWDMDETLILLKSLLNGTYAEGFSGSKDAQKGVEIGKMWEKHILDVCDDYFFYEQIENYNMPFLDSLRDCDDGLDLSNYDFNQDQFSTPYDDANKRKLAYRHRAVALKYSMGLQHIFNEEMMKLWDELYDMTDKFTDGWLSSARTFLEQCSNENKASTPIASIDGTTEPNATKYNRVNILVTSGSLIPSLVKCMLFRVDHFITHENVYSSWEVGKTQCFEWIKERYSSADARFCAIGDGWEECEAAQAMKWPFVKIDIRPNSSHRFPGLTMRTLGFYFSVVYGNPSDDSCEDLV